MEYILNILFEEKYVMFSNLNTFGLFRILVALTRKMGRSEAIFSMILILFAAKAQVRLQFINLSFRINNFSVWSNSRKTNITNLSTGKFIVWRQNSL